MELLKIPFAYTLRICSGMALTFGHSSIQVSILHLSNFIQMRYNFHLFHYILISYSWGWLWNSLMLLPVLRSRPVLFLLPFRVLNQNILYIWYCTRKTSDIQFLISVFPLNELPDLLHIHSIYVQDFNLLFFDLWWSFRWIPYCGSILANSYISG